MAASKLIVVVGATGTQGGSVARTFLKEPGWRVRGITRDVSSSASRRLQAEGVEMVSANLDQTQSLISAFEGANAIFGVTDFLGPFSDPRNRERLNPGQSLNEWVYEYEKQQGKNIFDAAVATKGLERLVFSSLSDARKWSNGKYNQVWHFDSKAHAVRDANSTHPDFFESKVSCIQVGMYLSIWLKHPLFMPQKDSEDMFNFFVGMPVHAPLPLIATEKDTGPFVKAILEAPHVRTLIAYREWMTLEYFVKTWARVLNVKAQTTVWSYQEMVDAIGPEFGPEFAEAMAYAAEFGYEARDDPTLVHPRDLGVPMSLGTIEEWIRNQDWSAVLNQ